MQVLFSSLAMAVSLFGQAHELLVLIRSAETQTSLHFSHTQSVKIEEDSDQNIDLPFWTGAFLGGFGAYAISTFDFPKYLELVLTFFGALRCPL